MKLLVIINLKLTVKLVTQWNISTISYDDNSSAFDGSYMEEWLNDTSVDGFLYNLREPEKFIKMDSKWNASQMSDTSKPPSEEEGGTIVEDAVALLNVYEYTMSQSSTIIYNQYFLNNWTITPSNSNSLYYIIVTGTVYNNGNCSSKNGVRPSINLKPEIKIVSGDGSEANPYRLEGDNDTNLSSTLLNTRYSGEYITFGTGENNLYRIVSHETEGLTKITSAEPLKENSTFKTISFGDSVYYSSANTIGSFLNGEYLTNGDYLTEEQVNMIEDNTTWYLGAVANGQNYKLAKYTDTSMSGYATHTDAKVGLLRLGELMAGQFHIYPVNDSYFTLTPNDNEIFVILNDSRSYSYSVNSLRSIKPSFNLKSNVIITNGDGTLNSPFEIQLDN